MYWLADVSPLVDIEQAMEDEGYIMRQQRAGFIGRSGLLLRKSEKGGEIADEARKVKGREFTSDNRPPS